MHFLAPSPPPPPLPHFPSLPFSSSLFPFPSVDLAWLCLARPLTFTVTSLAVSPALGEGEGGRGIFPCFERHYFARICINSLLFCFCAGVGLGMAGRSDKITMIVIAVPVLGFSLCVSRYYHHHHPSSSSPPIMIIVLAYSLLRRIYEW